MQPTKNNRLNDLEQKLQNRNIRIGELEKFKSAFPSVDDGEIARKMVEDRKLAEILQEFSKLPVYDREDMHEYAFQVHELVQRLAHTIEPTVESPRTTNKDNLVRTARLLEKTHEMFEVIKSLAIIFHRLPRAEGVQGKQVQEDNLDILSKKVVSLIEYIEDM